MLMYTTFKKCKQSVCLPFVIKVTNLLCSYLNLLLYAFCLSYTNLKMQPKVTGTLILCSRPTYMKCFTIKSVPKIVCVTYVILYCLI